MNQRTNRRLLAQSDLSNQDRSTYEDSHAFNRDRRRGRRYQLRLLNRIPFHPDTPHE